jgi:hypothetical protein
VRRKTEIIAENIQVLYRPADYRSPVTEEANQATQVETNPIPTLDIEDIF